MQGRDRLAAITLDLALLQLRVQVAKGADEPGGIRLAGETDEDLRFLRVLLVGNKGERDPVDASVPGLLDQLVKLRLGLGRQFLDENRRIVAWRRVAAR